eukprot:TRINITY_DN3843_c0_g1_i1.p1 TRINITY_DN3843_c0_g1~~TRINITY_DN3843_c0_g1_i1.p1  ORF type:complete len:125 (-),score=53.29 TRINITY_DN3843_c0_g1_i1:373-747(-)
MGTKSSKPKKQKESKKVKEKKEEPKEEKKEEPQESKEENKKESNEESKEEKKESPKTKKNKEIKNKDDTPASEFSNNFSVWCKDNKIKDEDPKINQMWIMIRFFNISTDLERNIPHLLSNLMIH